MNTLLIIIFFLLLPTLIICFLAILEAKQKKQIKEDLKKKICQLAKENKLQIVQTRFFHRKAIAMDRKKKKLVFVRHYKEFDDQFCIDLKTLAFCRIVKIEDESSKSVEKVFIELKYTGNNKVSRLVFYDKSFNNIRAKETLLREAEYWKNKINLHRKSRSFNYAFEYVL